MCLSCKSSTANTALERLLSFMNWCHMSIYLPFLCKPCITNITIERLFLHELILFQEADEKFELFGDKNATWVKFWSFMFLCYMLVQPWKPSVLNKNWSFFKRLMIYALSFYGPKMILDHPNHFGQVPIFLDGSNLVWSGSNHFGQVQIITISQ